MPIKLHPSIYVHPRELNSTHEVRNADLRPPSFPDHGRPTKSLL